MIKRQQAFLDTAVSNCALSDSTGQDSTGVFLLRFLAHASTGYIGYPNKGIDFDFLKGSPEERMRELLGHGYVLIRGQYR